MKQTSSEALATLGIKPPTLPTPTFTQKMVSARTEQINEFMGVVRDQRFMSRWIGGMTKIELGILDGALEVCADTSSTPAVLREQLVIKGILHSLARGSDEEDRVVLETLALRKAFCSEWSQKESPEAGNNELKSYIFGIRGSKEVPLKKPEWFTGLTAPIQFAYELNARFPEEDFLPTTNHAKYRSREASAVRTRQFKDIDLANFLYQNRDNIDTVIELAAKHRTSDVAVLRGLVENRDGATSLVTGWL